MPTIFLEIGEWGEQTFPRSTDHSKLTHLAKEFEELKADPTSGEEMADMVMLISHLAYAHGIDLMAELQRKLRICRARHWGLPDLDGVVEHIRQEKDA
jgi:NTP pyrophosphatase (non-canonical NTP hydrolase)